MVIVYGIPNCDSVQKARAWLTAQGLAHEFHDFKKAGVPADRLSAWAAVLGWQKLLNRQGTTWRKLDPSAEAGGELLIPKATEGILGRIAAQLAKQVIFQKVREAERDTVYNEYIGHVNEIVNATVKRLEGPDVILDIGKAEARMGRKEQSRLESFAVVGAAFVSD